MPWARTRYLETVSSEALRGTSGRRLVFRAATRHLIRREHDLVLAAHRGISRAKIRHLASRAVTITQGELNVGGIDGERSQPVAEHN
jgi:hypothetical protein